MDRKIRVGILGGAGYTAGELVRLLLGHPAAEIAFVHSESNAGNRLDSVHGGITGDTDMRFTSDLPIDCADVLFFCFGHGKSAEFLASHPVPEGVKIVDLAQDFRIAAQGNGFVYGLPELDREGIAGADRVANPGCFATCIQIALLPAAKAGLLTGPVSVNAITGSTGAGQKPTFSTHFSWRDNNMSIYKPFTHQHMAEIRQGLARECASVPAVNFIPYRGCFPRGIFATAVVETEAGQAEVEQAYKEYYAGAAFTRYSDSPADLKQVVNTNKAVVHCDVIEGKLLVTACIDNLLKGASGQALQNMNLMFGIGETEGLRLKASAF